MTEQDYEKIAKVYDLSIEEAKEYFPNNEDGELNLAKAYGEKARSTNEWAEYAKKNGYDGVIIKDVNDTVDLSTTRSTDYITFEANQIKSVYNRGTFSPESDNIYYQTEEKLYSNRQLERMLDNPQENKDAILDVYENYISKYNDILASRLRTIAINLEGTPYENALSIDTKQEMEGLSNENFKNKMLETLRSLKGKKIYNQSLNGDIEIRTSSIKKYKSFFADKNKRLIVPYISELLEKAQFIAENTYTPETESNIVANWKSDLPINIDNDSYNVHLTVKQDNNGHFFGMHKCKKKAPRTVPATNPGDKGLTSDVSEDTLTITPATDIVNRTSYQTGSGEGELNLEVSEGAGREPTAAQKRQNRMIYSVMGQYEPAKKLITLFQGKDTTTLTHELLHHYLPIYLTELEKANQYDKLKGLYSELGAEVMPSWQQAAKK